MNGHNESDRFDHLCSPKVCYSSVVSALKATVTLCGSKLEFQITDCRECVSAAVGRGGRRRAEQDKARLGP